MALEYCSQHERLFVFAQDRWIAFTEEEVSQIELTFPISELGLCSCSLPAPLT
jgi:hypothetical protein